MDHTTLSNFPSKIMRLGQDILWFIFSINADMDAPIEYDAFLDKEFVKISALDNVIIVSQVCQSWRNLLLRSPSLWGRVLRLDRLSQLGEIGRKEILNRTGNAPLCIKGRVQGRRSNYSFFSDLFQQDWSRIRKIDTRVGRDGLYHNSLWDVCLRPTPHLISFKITFEGARNRTFSSEDGFLFAGDAPLLQEICTKNICFLVNAPWARHLRRLRLETAEFKATEILDAIKQMSLLEYLDLRYMAGPSLIPLPAEESISLPNLVDLRLTNKLKISLPFLHAIKPSPHCGLIWITHAFGHEAVSQEEIVAVRRVLRRYSEMYFSFNKVTSLNLNLSNSNFEFSVSLSMNSPLPRINTEHSTNKPTFYVNLTSGFPSGTTKSFLHSFSEIGFSGVIYFNFQPHPSSCLNEKWSEVATFLKSFSSVETLSTVGYGIDVLRECPKDDLILPSLRQLKLHNAMPEDIVWSFLATRWQEVPISMLDLSSSQIGDWGFLESFDGMKVVWKSDDIEAEYTCGVGQPERLNFGYQRAFEEELLELAGA